MSEEKKTHPEHKYSVTFVSKVGTKNLKEKTRPQKIQPTIIEKNKAGKNSYRIKVQAHLLIAAISNFHYSASEVVSGEK